MKKVLLFLIISFTGISCESSAISKGRKTYKTYLNKTLKDPESLKIYQEKVKKLSDLEVLFEVEYGAKNTYGGYVRESVKFKTIEGSDLIDVDGKLIVISDL